MLKVMSKVVLLTLVSTMLFWHEAGHRAVGSIAHEHLTQVAKDQIDDLLKSLPDPHTAKNTVTPPDPFHLLPQGFQPSGEATLKPATLEEAADWPDKVRGTWLHREDWHFINFSVNGPGGHAAPLVGGKAVDVIVALIAVAQDTTQPKPTRAIALAWVAHLVGDIHQPLHAVAYFDTAHPDGDRGGNRYLLKATGKPATSPNLHSFWDGVVGEGPSDVPALIERGSRLPQPSASQVAIGMTSLRPTVLSWAKGSVAIAKSSVYRIGPDGKPRLNALASQFKPASQPGARDIADARVQVAGLRLAALLNAAFK
ncbi:MAG: Nuclease [Chthonomonadales bacterium]|nr:Nuclease [Chthonomonadales bacterium]